MAIAVEGDNVQVLATVPVPAAVCAPPICPLSQIETALLSFCQRTSLWLSALKSSRGGGQFKVAFKVVSSKTNFSAFVSMSVPPGPTTRTLVLESAVSV